MSKFNTLWDYEYWMKSNGMFVGLNTPDALSSEEFNHGLPPYAKRKSYLVDKYPACPKKWMQSEGRKASYFVPVEEGKGMWLDFNKNFDNDYHVAVAISIQGVNPLTGLACEDTYLEQYIDNCPKCDIPFKPDRYCEKCNMKYPKQNYLSTTGTPRGMLWLDGFRSIEGIVCQYILTAEKMRGVASGLIGKDRVFAIGVSFFLSKEKKNFNLEHIGPMFYSTVHTPISWITAFEEHDDDDDDDDDYEEESYSSSYSSTDYSYSSADDNSGQVRNLVSCDSFGAKLGGKRTKSSNAVQLSSLGTQSQNAYFTQEVKTKKIEVGAGANIDQLVYDDPEHIGYWREEPEAVICINYALEKEVEQILAQGEKNLEGHSQGFLQNVLVGN